MPIQVAGLALLFPQESGSLAMFTAIRRASSLRSLPLNNGSFLLDDTPCVASLTLRSCSRSILSSSCLFWVPWGGRNPMSASCLLQQRKCFETAHWTETCQEHGAARPLDEVTLQVQWL